MKKLTQCLCCGQRGTLKVWGDRPKYPQKVGVKASFTFMDDESWVVLTYCQYCGNMVEKDHRALILKGDICGI